METNMVKKTDDWVRRAGDLQRRGLALLRQRRCGEAAKALGDGLALAVEHGIAMFDFPAYVQMCLDVAEAYAGAGRTQAAQTLLTGIVGHCDTRGVRREVYALKTRRRLADLALKSGNAMAAYTWLRTNLDLIDFENPRALEELSPSIKLVTQAINSIGDVEAAKAARAWYKSWGTRIRTAVGEANRDQQTADQN
jgi:hypothetical protein